MRNIGKMKVGDLYKDKGNRLLLKEILFNKNKGCDCHGCTEKTVRAFVFWRLDEKELHDELELLPEWSYNNFGAGFLGNIYDL